MIKVILHSLPSTSIEEVKSVLGAIQFIAIFLPRLSEEAQRLSQILKRKNGIEMDREKKRFY